MIFVGLPAGERLRGNELGRQVAGRQGRPVEMATPDQQIVDRRGEAAFAALRVTVLGDDTFASSPR